MSVRLMSAVWRLDLPATDKLVLLALADAANDEGVTWIALKSRRADGFDLRRKCSLAERTVQGAIKRLCQAGLLARVERPGRGVTYTVRPGTPVAAASASPSPPLRTALAAPAPAADSPPAAAHAGNPSPSISESAKIRPRVPGRRAVAVEPPAWVPEEAWSAFVAMRRAMPRVPFTDAAAKGVIARLETLKGEGHCPEKLLTKAVIHGWRTVFAGEDTRAPKASAPPSPPQLMAERNEELACFYERIGRDSDAEECRREARKLRGWAPRERDKGMGSRPRAIGDLIKAKGGTRHGD